MYLVFKYIDIFSAITVYSVEVWQHVTSSSLPARPSRNFERLNLRF